MDETRLKRLQAAVAPAWWTLLIFWGMMMFSWLVFLHIMRNRPDFVINAWGGGNLTWDQIQTLWITFHAVMKLILFAATMITLWLTLYVRRLKREM